MSTTRIKDISKTTTDLASDTYGVFDGATNGTQKMARNDMYADWAAAYVAAPTTYKLAPLNSGTNKIDATYLPVSGDTPKGEWNASSNSPALADGSGVAGDYYDVTTAGTQNLGSGPIIFTVGDVVKYNGSTWFKIDSVANILDGSATAADGRSALSVNSIDEDAQANALKVTAPALYFNGTSSVVTVAHDDKFSFTDGVDDLPFTVSAWVKMEDASSFGIVTKYVNSGQYEWAFWVDGSDKLVFRLTENTDIGDYSQIKSDATVTAYEGQWVHVAASYAGAGPTAASGNDFSAAASGMALYINGSAIAATGSNVDYPGMTAGSDPIIIGKILGSFSEGSIRDCKIFNRELTSAEIAQLARGNDLGFSEEFGGALGAVYTSNFSAGVDGFTGDVRLTSAGNIDDATSGTGEDDALRLTCTDTTNSTHYTTKAGALLNGRRVRLSARVYIPGSNSNVDGIRFGDTITNNLFISATPAPDTWVTVSGEGVAGGQTALIMLQSAGSVTFQDAGGDDVVYIKDITITEIGTLADFRSERYDTSTNKLYDLSDNAFVGTGTSVSLTGREQPVYETGTWTPSITFGGGSTGITYTTQEGYYTRIGETVFINCVITVSNKGSDTGAFRLLGLPFTPKNTAAGQQGLHVPYAVNLAALTSVPTAFVQTNTAEVFMYDWDTTGASLITDANFTNTSQIRFSGTYQIQ